MTLTYALYFKGIPHVPRATYGSICATKMPESILYANNIYMMLLIF